MEKIGTLQRTPSATYFTDRNLGKQFPAILRKAGVRVERFDDHFAHNLPEHERPWIARFYPPTPVDVVRKLKPRGRIELWIPG